MKRYGDYLKGKSKPICLIHGPGNSSDEYKVLVYSGSKYAKIVPTKDRSHDPVKINKFNRQQENNYISKSSVY